MTYDRTDADGEPVTLGTIGEVAAALGEPISRVSMWHQRRATTGFPESVDHLLAGNATIAAHFDIDAVRIWRIFYVPDKGSGRRKLTPGQVADIRRAYAAGGVTYRALAALHHVTHTVIGRIVRAG